MEEPITQSRIAKKALPSKPLFCFVLGFFNVRNAIFSSSFRKSTVVQLYGARCGSHNYMLCLGAHTAKRPHLNLMSLCAIGPEDEEGEQEWTDRYSIYGESAGLVSESALPVMCASPPHHQDLRWLKTGIFFCLWVSDKTNLLINPLIKLLCFT